MSRKNTNNNNAIESQASATIKTPINGLGRFDGFRNYRCSGCNKVTAVEYEDVCVSLVARSNSITVEYRCTGCNLMAEIPMAHFLVDTSPVTQLQPVGMLVTNHQRQPSVAKESAPSTVMPQTAKCRQNDE